MRHPLPLDPLRTFATAAETGSFAETARRLNLTPSAVSHQMRALERALATALFERRGRAVHLNVAGASFLKAVEPALQAIDGAAAKLSDADATRGPLTIASSAMFANSVLSQCLPDFVDAFPAIECKVALMENDAVLAHEFADIGILFGRGTWRGRWSMALGDVYYAPVCSPRLLSGRELDEDAIAQMLRHVVIHIDDGEEWRRWYAATRLRPAWAPERQLFTNDVSLALTIAANGGGVTLASDLVASAYLSSGALVRPFAVAIDVNWTWHITVPRDRLHMPRARLFVSWLARRLRVPEPEFG
jgi:LysR family glycine cleavage system transcriptional activator